MKSGIAVGFIGGIGMAIIATIVVVASVMTGWLRDFPTIETIVKIHIVINIFWGTIFGIIYAKLHDSIPGKGIWKGLVYGLIIYLFSNIYVISYSIVYGDSSTIGFFIGGIGGIYVFIVYGIVLGVLYKKESKK